MEDSSRKRRGAPRQQHREHSRYDQALFAAKNANCAVLFGLACETYFTDEDCTVKGHVLQIDKYDIEIRPFTDEGLSAKKTLWIKKGLIVSTEVLP